MNTMLCGSWMANVCCRTFTSACECTIGKDSQTTLPLKLSLEEQHSTVKRFFISGQNGLLQRSCLIKLFYPVMCREPTWSAPTQPAVVLDMHALSLTRLENNSNALALLAQEKIWSMRKPAEIWQRLYRSVFPRNESGTIFECGIHFCSILLRV